MNHPPEAEDEPLDDALSDTLSQAKWKDDDPDRVERLKRHWAMLSVEPQVACDLQPRPARRLSPARSIGLLVAASVLAAIGLRVGFPPTNENIAKNAASQTAATPGPSTSENQKSKQLQFREEDIAARPPTINDLDSHLVRSPNMLERIAFHEHLKQRRNPVRLKQILESAVRELAAAPKSDPAAIAKRLVPDADFHEQEIHAALPVADPHLRVAAVRLLEHIATHRSVPVLMSWGGNPETHGPVARTLVRVGSSETATRVINAEQNRKLQRSLLTILVKRNDVAATELFLQYVADTRSRSLALEAIQTADPPVEILLSYLDAPHSELRMAAAVAVGSMCQEDITQSLIGLALEERGRPEPLIALLTCDGDAAQGFLRSAGRRVDFAAAITGAKSRLRAAYPNVMLR